MSDWDNISLNLPPPLPPDANAGNEAAGYVAASAAAANIASVNTVTAPVTVGTTPGGATYNLKTGQGISQSGQFVDPSQASNPQAEAAAILSAEYQEWQNIYQPIELNAMQQVSTNNPAVLTNAVQMATENAAATNQATQGIAERQNQSLGIVPTAGQAAATSRELNIQGSLNTAAAANVARQNQRTLNEQILTGVAVNPQLQNASNIPNQLIT